MPLVKKSIVDIKQEINNDNKVYWFLINNKKGSVIAKGQTKLEAKNNLFNKIDVKPEKYIGSRLWRLTISTHTEKADNNNYGDVRVYIENYKVMRRTNDIHIKKEVEPGNFGPIWFDKGWLEYNTWKKEYITNIINKLVMKTVKIKTTGKNFYRMYFI